MSLLKRFWQIVIIMLLYAVMFFIINIKRMTLVEYIVLVLFAVNIAAEFFDICSNE